MDNEKKQVTYNSSITGETQVTFDIQQYMNNRAMFIGLMCNEDGYEEPFGDVTVNLSVAAPNYCGYLNVNDMPDIEKFITDNDLGEFTGFTQRSGFCEYPCLLRLPLSLPPILINPLSPAFLSFQYSPHTYPFHPDTVL